MDLALPDVAQECPATSGVQLPSVTGFPVTAVPLGDAQVVAPGPQRKNDIVPVGFGPAPPLALRPEMSARSVIGSVEPRVVVVRFGVVVTLTLHSPSLPSA